MRTKHGLGYVRRRVAAGDFKADDVKRWRKELGAAKVDAIVEELAPKKSTASKADGSTK